MTVDPHTDDRSLEPGMDRRSFLTKAGYGVAGFAASSAILAACSTTTVDEETGAAEEEDDASTDETAASTDDSDAEEVTEVQTDGPELEWNMATSWPTSLVTLFGSANIFADEVARLTGGRFQISPKPAGEIVGGLDVLPAVRDGGAEAGHTASYYYVNLSPVQQFGTAVPFGLTQRQQNAWLYEGGGIDILNEFYAEEYGIIAFPAGATGCQMGGWFSKEINTVADLQGLKMRIPGIAGTVLNNLGGEQVTVAGGEILTSIETGAIDAAEFVGPTDDLILGLDELGSDLFYYHPGWWEPGYRTRGAVQAGRLEQSPRDLSSGHPERGGSLQHADDGALRRAQPTRSSGREGIRRDPRVLARADGGIQGGDRERPRRHCGRGSQVRRDPRTVAGVPRRHLRVAWSGRTVLSHAADRHLTNTSSHPDRTLCVGRPVCGSSPAQSSVGGAVSRRPTQPPPSAPWPSAIPAARCRCVRRSAIPL